MILFALLVACGQTPTSGPPSVAPAVPAPRPAVSPPGGFHAPSTYQPAVTVTGPHRSLLIVSLDTVRADHLSLYGGRARVPTLEALATQGVWFEHAYCHFPETAMSHWSLLTSVLPEVHGNVPAHAGSLWTGPTAAEIAKAAGYATGAFIGGITLTDRASGLARGFDRYDDRFPVDSTDMKRPAALVTRRAVSWIDAQPGPWFAFVHYFDAHFPYTPDPPWNTAYDPGYTGHLTGSDADLAPYRDGGKAISPADLAHVVALYDGEISELDGHLAPLIEAAGPDAVVVVTADHGESFGHGYLFNHRESLWDATLHVPLIIRAPDVPPRKVSEQVGLIDVLPTVLDLAGLAPDRRMQGHDLAPSLRRGGSVEVRTRVYAITDPWVGEGQFAVRTPTTKVIWRARSSSGRPGEHGDQALVYDLVADPGELHPLGQVPAALAGARATYRTLIRGLFRWRAAPPAARTVSPEEVERLKELGYMAPSEPANPAVPSDRPAPAGSGVSHPVRGPSSPRR